MVKLQRGFSLIELVMTLVISAILLGIAIPSYTAYVQQENYARAINQLNAAYRLARSEAVSRSEWVYLRAASGGWQNGYQVIAKNEALPIKVFPAAAKEISITEHKVGNELRVNGNGSIPVGGAYFSISSSKLSKTSYVCTLISGQHWVSESACP